MTSEIVIVIVSASITAVVTFLYWRLTQKKYDLEKNKAILEAVRNSIEKQIYSLNDRLIKSEERWRDVNHLLLRKEYIENKNPILNSRRTYYSEFLKANGITENDLIIDSKLIFVLTPFNDLFSKDYNVIREVCFSMNYKCLRGDENYFKGDIFPEMLKIIVKANLIIANINGRNPNVLYELGIAQALDKPVILISREPDKLPIDIKSKRFLIYSDYEDLQKIIQQELNNILLSK